MAELDGIDPLGAKEGVVEIVEELGDFLAGHEGEPCHWRIGATNYAPDIIMMSNAILASTQ
ncbi:MULTISPECIES: hypothetical protein [unclassified Corynebacterium]|uniref:hypothetical protein n=1 Tax=unclassified Corynebacterium TaxID=2624378 RepID=UPI004034BBB1